MVALNIQTSFLSPPVAMAAFYLKGVAPPQSRINQIFAGMHALHVHRHHRDGAVYIFPEIGMWLPSVLYGRDTGTGIG